MANSVDLVIGSEAIKQVENLISKLSLADAELLKISQSATTASKGITGISTPSGLDKAVTNTAALNAELERQNKIIQALEIEIKKLSYARQNNNKQSAEEAVNQRILNQNAINEAKSTSNLIGAYQKLDLEHKKAITNAQNLGVKYGETSTQFLKAAEKANLLDVKLKAIDSSLGKNQRNVGNYASGFSALGNSINQLTREAPAFANSINTGFMALSNNFPALFDAINGIRTQNKALAAEGKPTVSVLKSLAGAIYSWQTLLSIGVTLLTIYGAKLIDYAFNTDAAKKAIDGLNRSYEKNDELMKIMSNNIDHQIVLQKELMRQQGKDQKDINQLDEEGAKLKLKNSEIIRDAIKKQFDLAKTYREDEKKGLTDFNGNMITRIKGTKNLLEARKNSEDEVFEVLKNNLIKAENEVKANGFKLSEISAQNKTKEIEEANKLKNDKSKLREDELKDLYEMRKKELELELAYIDQKVNNEDSYYTDRLSSLDDDLIKRTEIAKLDYSEQLRLAKDSQSKQKTALINFQLEKIKLLEDYNKKKNELEQLDLNPITKLATSKNQTKNPFQSVIDSAEKAVKGLKTPSEKLKSDWKDTFNEIADSAQKAGETIAGFSEMNFKNEYARLEAQKDISLKFAGDSTAAKQKIEEDYEKKRKEIANRENKAKQRQAIFSIAIDIAKGIAKSIAESPLTFGLPFSAIAAATGAAQIALVSSQKIPEYFAGTDNHQGGLMLVNDGGGSNYQEKVILPNGKEVIPEGRNVLMNAPKGTKVLTHEQQIREMLNERGISMSANYTKNNGMTAEEMDMVMSKHFSRIQVNNTSFDKNGFSSWSEKNGNRTKQNANRVSRTGFKV